MDLLRLTVFSGQKLSPKYVLSYYKNKECNHCVFLFSWVLLFSSLFLFLLSFSFFTVILELLRLKKPAFWHLFTQITANFVRLVFKKFAKHTNIFTSKMAEKWMVSGTGNPAWSCIWPESVRLRSSNMVILIWPFKMARHHRDLQSCLWHMTDIRFRLWDSHTCIGNEQIKTLHNKIV